MTHCPKCSHSSINGPVFVQYYAPCTGKLIESLEYTCARCGYRERVPCHDAKKPNRPADWRPEAHKAQRNEGTE